MSKYNKLVNKVELFEKLSLYGTRGSFLNRLAQLKDPNELPFNMVETPNEGFGPPSPQKPVATKYPNISTSVQKSLDFLANEANAPLTKNKHGNYVESDGILGPETRKALDWFATANGLVGKTDTELFTAIAEKQKEAVANATKQISTQGPVAGPEETSNIKAPTPRV